MAGAKPLPEALRRVLSADRKPVSPLAPPFVRALPAAAWAVCALVLVLAVLGLRSDAPRLGPLLTWGPALVQALLGFVLVVLALAAAVPGRGAGPGLAALATLAALAALVGEAVLASRAGGARAVPGPWLHGGPACLLLTLLFGASALLLVAVLLARTGPLGASLSALLGGAGCGVLAEGIYRLHCGLADLRHVLTWHAGGVLLLALAGLLAGLAWDRREIARMSARLLLAVVLLVLPNALFAADIPATPAGRQLARWLDALNSGERPKLEELLKQYRDLEGRTVEELQQFRRETGGFDLKKVEGISPTSLSAFVQERDSDQFARVTLEVEAAPPHLIGRMTLMVSPRPAEFAIPRMSEADALAATRARVADLAKKGRFSGTVLVAKNGKVLYSEAVGLADREAGIPNRLDTKFNLGSMNKMFTAVAVAQLVQQGKIRPGDPLGKFLPDYPSVETRGVTIEQLLTHTGGTGDIFGPEFDAHIPELKEPKDYIALYGKRAPEFPPGSRFGYSNYGFVLLGAVIEKVSGQGYYDYVRSHLYKPAGMANSDSYLKTEKVPNMAAGYTSEEGPALENNYATRPMRGSPAGGGYSTVEDLLRFATALTSNKLLNAEYTDLVTTGKTDSPGRGKYGWGFGDTTEGGVRVFGHGGGAPGINAELRIQPVSGYVVTVMANLDPPAATRLAAFIGARLPAKWRTGQEGGPASFAIHP